MVSTTLFNPAFTFVNPNRWLVARWLAHYGDVTNKGGLDCLIDDPARWDYSAIVWYYSNAMDSSGNDWIIDSGPSDGYVIAPNHFSGWPGGGPGITAEYPDPAREAYDVATDFDVFAQYTLANLALPPGYAWIVRHNIFVNRVVREDDTTKTKSFPGHAISVGRRGYDGVVFQLHDPEGPSYLPMEEGFDPFDEENWPALADALHEHSSGVSDYIYNQPDFYIYAVEGHRTYSEAIDATFGSNYVHPEPFPYD